MKKRRLKCRPCGYTWDYKGGSEHYTSCPRCLSRVHTERNVVKVDGIR